MTVEAVLDRLLDETGASRCTLRRDVPGDTFFPVVAEALAAGVASLRDEHSVDLRTQPVVRELRRSPAQVVQDDCRAASDDPAFHAMLAAFGGLGAQIVTPVVVEGRLEGIVSVHHLGGPRAWDEPEIRAAAAATEDIARLLSAASA